MKAVLWGANGAMGRLIGGILDSEVVGRVSLDGENGTARDASELGDVGADMVIDFSHHSAVEQVLAYAAAHGCAAVIGTTGHTQQEMQRIREAAQTIPVFCSGNMSLGIAVLCRLAAEATAAFPEADIEIVEIHHNRKVDAPSGTARMLFEAIRRVRPQALARCGRAGEGRRTKDEIGISSLRMGSVVGVHEIHIHTGSQCLTLRHEAVDRRMLAEGAVEAARFMAGKKPGLYGMEHLLQSHAKGA